MTGPLPAARPRVGVDFHVWEGSFQGSRSHLLGLYAAAALQSDEFEFVLLSSQPDSLRAAHPAFSLPHVRVEHLPVVSRVLRLAVQLPLMRRRLGLDVLHLQYRVPPLFPGTCLCTIHDVLYATHPQYFEPRFGAMLRASGWFAARRAERILTVSEYSRQAIAATYGIPGERIAITPNGVDLSRFHPGPADAHDSALLARLGLQPGGYFLTVGRLEPRKNHRGLLAAYRRLGTEAPPLVIVGQRDFGYQEWIGELQAPDLAGRVKLLETVDDDTLPVLLRHASVFAYPALAEGFGIPVIEAMASGAPVVTSANTALAEVAGTAAELVDPQDAAALAAALQRLHADRELRRQRAEAGLERARQFGWAASAAVLLSVLRDLLATQNRR